MSVQLFPRSTRQALTKTGGYLRGYTHSLQPYAGCEFSCRYCYVREMVIQRANPYRLPWSQWLAPKLDIAARLLREAERGATRDARIFCSSATDPYTPRERHLGLTRSCLEVLVDHPPAFLLLQTRSPFVTRDADLVGRLPNALVSMTVTTDDEAVRRRFEPNAPGLGVRLDTLAALRRAGVRTQAAVSPLLPCDPRHLAEQLEPLCERVVIDDFFAGDGAGGKRSRAALQELDEAGEAAWARPGYAASALEIFRNVFGTERVGYSAAGFAAPALS